MKNILVTLFVLLLTTSPFANASLIDVYAKAHSSSGGAGASTSVLLSAGDAFSVSAGSNDLWNAGRLPRWSNADGLVAELFATGSDDSGQAAGTKIGQSFPLWAQHGISLPFGSLVGSIDNNFFLIGTNFTGNAIASGELFLWYWDSNNGDNSEKIQASIYTQGQPNGHEVVEPLSLALFALGLLGLGISRKRKLF